MAKNSVAKRAKPVDFISHDPTLISAMNFSTQEFYARVEKALAALEIPDIKITRVDWKEGGPLSPGREYLRIQRERYVFDVCAAPFGTGFFVSLWCAERPLRSGLLRWALLITVCGLLIASLIANSFEVVRALERDFSTDWLTASYLFGGLLVAIVVGAIAIVGLNLDMFMMGVPVIGIIYEKYFRAITYYRVDMMCMYRIAVRQAIKTTIADITKSQGILPPTLFEEKPVMKALLA